MFHFILYHIHFQLLLHFGGKYYLRIIILTHYIYQIDVVARDFRDLNLNIKIIQTPKLLCIYYNIIAISLESKRDQIIYSNTEEHLILQLT